MEFDLSDEKSVQSAVKQVRPHAVLHLAALSSPLVCEKNAELAKAINCPSHLIDAVQEHAVENCLFVFTSTDLVFDGNFPPYSPHLNVEGVDDGCSFSAATTVYGATKREFEKKVLTRLSHGVVLRLSNMIGPRFVWRNAGTKFMQFLFEALQKRETIGLRCDEIRSFVSVHDVVEIISRCLLREELTEYIRGKAFNVGGPEGLSRLDMARELAAISAVDLHVDESLPPQLSNDSDSPTSSCPSSSHWFVHTTSNAQGIAESGIKTPKDVTLVVKETEEVFGLSFQSMKQTIEKCINDMK